MIENLILFILFVSCFLAAFFSGIIVAEKIFVLKNVKPFEKKSKLDIKKDDFDEDEQKKIAHEYMNFIMYDGEVQEDFEK